MKTFILGLSLLSSLSAFSGNDYMGSSERSVRLTNKNIATVISQPAEVCTNAKNAYIQRASHTTVITLKSGEVLNLKTSASEVDSCSRVKDTANARGRTITNILYGILNDDADVFNIDGKVVCKRVVANVVVNEETGVATNFETKGIVVKCP
jgi:hypothetical protein